MGNGWRSPRAPEARVPSNVSGVMHVLGALGPVLRLQASPPGAVSTTNLFSAAILPDLPGNPGERQHPGAGLSQLVQHAFSSESYKSPPLTWIQSHFALCGGFFFFGGGVFCCFGLVF